MKKKVFLSVILVVFLIGCGASQHQEITTGYKAWSKQAGIVWMLERQYARLMTSDAIPSETKQNLRDEVWPVLDDAMEVLEAWKVTLDAGTTPSIQYNDELNRLIDEVKLGMPEGGDLDE